MVTLYKIMHLVCPPLYRSARHAEKETRLLHIVLSVVGVNVQDHQHVHYEPIGEQWVSRFMGRHPELQTIIPRLIEAAQVKDTSAEALPL